jgi:diguanylate cyclase (GGDEF)-like protein
VVLGAVGAGYIFDQWCRQMVRERTDSIWWPETVNARPAGGSTPPWADLPISDNGDKASSLKKPAQHEMISVPSLLAGQLIRLPGLEFLIWYDHTKRIYYFWGHPANAGFHPSQMVAELERVPAGSEGRVRLIPSAWPLWKYQLSGKKYLFCFDLTKSWVRLGRLSAVMGMPLVLLLIFLLWLITLVLGRRMVKAIRGIEHSLKDIFMGNYDIKFEAREFAFTQQVANIMNQMFYFFKQNVKQREISHQRDNLTGLYTRRYLINAMEKEIKRTKRYNHALSFILIDIDHFKLFNDTYGHLLGDKVLSQTARIFREETRETDIVGRYGGEEIGVILSETVIKEALIVAEKLRKLVEISKYTYNGKTVNVTISMGVTSFIGGEEDTVPGIIQRADEALYEAKRNGRNRVCRRI